MFDGLKRLENDVSPFALTFIFVALLIVMSLFIVFFRGEFIAFYEEEPLVLEKIDPCVEYVSLEFNTLCETSNNLKFGIKNIGNLEIESLLFQVIEYDNVYLTESDSGLSVNSIVNYSVNYNDADNVNQIFVIPTVLFENNLITCDAESYSVVSISSCTPSSGGGGGSGGGGSGGGNGGDDATPCIDEDGDGYGENCDAGTDCDDINDFTWQLIQVYMDVDRDGFGAGELLENPICIGDINDATTLEVLRIAGKSLNDNDCVDSDDEINPDMIEVCGDGIDQNCDFDLCVDCQVMVPIPNTGCRCDHSIYYDGYCCPAGWGAIECAQIFQGSNIRVPFFESFLQFLFNF